MTGRDPHEQHRGATPLELLFDLTFVVAFSLAGNEVAHLLAEGHVGSALLGFGFVMFAVCWAWINFTWFASAFDTDDWFFRVTTMVQMVGVLVLALGIAPVFHSIDEGRHLDNGVLVAGYVVMRVAMVAQWLRVAAQDPEHRRTALTYAGAIGVAQVGWVVVALLDLPLSTVLVVLPLLYLAELGGPVLAERRGTATPWHAHHIAERYGLLVIIALGEGILGTIAAMAAVVDHVGWSAEAVLVVVAGTGLTFGMWWVYFGLPSGDLLHVNRDRSWAWGYGHILLFAAIAAVGAGLHVAAYVVEGEATIGVVGAVLAVAIPVLVFTLVFDTLAVVLQGRLTGARVAVLVATVGMLAVAVALAAGGMSLGWCLVVVMLAPAVTVVASESLGRLSVATGRNGMPT
jgi:low temperature requirement protein LtrA